MKLVIDRSKWLRGEGSDDSYLLRESDNKMCCLGIYAKSVGLTEEQILSQQTPNDVGVFLWKDASSHWLFQTNDTGCEDLMLINDSEEESQDEREKQIANIFLEHGVEVEFVG